jgi:CRISPR-associated endoribonuclease Cas6
MRIKINFTASIGEVPVNHQSLLNGYVHKCLGSNNEYHNKRNDYAISSLIGGFLNKENQTVDFKNGAYFVVSSLDLNFINKLLIGVISNPNFTHGMVFDGVDHISEEFYDGLNHFTTLSPFLIKEYSDKNKYSFLTLDDADFANKVKDYLIRKITKIDPKLDLSDFEVIVPKFDAHKVQKVMVKNVINKANKCQISIKCNKKIAELIYNIGLGQSTGSGFGTLYKTENHKLYRLGL